MAVENLAGWLGTAISAKDLCYSEVKPLLGNISHDLLFHRVLVTFIMLDSKTNVPISGSEAVVILENTQTLMALETAGFEASEFKAAGR